MSGHLGDLRAGRDKLREQVVILGVEQDDPEVFLVVVVVVDQVARELDHGLGGVKFPRGALSGLTYDGPGADFQPVVSR